ncbi:MAG: MBL fold metallo-hydrolase [Gammaproteobacteria bacterium]|jgi:glyoxylase-like metal-dependent hydrolase (beta-lactamase superfamily II)|nr:MBL fold metallo-hydrolase [Gammaproteobacteria bacterium]MDB4043252.1 MBL fold metallo-hydrolase [Gammaproteobacteria bacterium]|tara:strand:- start:477 stop:1436 length:960 start_codon:yes stop_codon:yes gene_type:complete
MRKILQTLFITMMIGSPGFIKADHHEDTLNIEQLAQAFGWDLEGAEIQSQKVADGLYVLFGIGGNIAVSIGEDGVLIVDDQLPQVMDKIEAAISKIGGGKIDYAINTHWHFDHAEGNNALGPKGTTIVAHSNARADMQQGGIVNMVLAKYNQQPYPKEALPVFTYDEGMQIHFNDGEIDLRNFSSAHTNGDTVVIFKAQNAVHMGDVFNNAGYPFIDVDSGGSIDGMINFCQQTLNISTEDTIVIPGHGPVTNIATLTSYIAMLKTVRDRVALMIADGKSMEEVVSAKPTADFDKDFGAESASLGFVNRVFTSLTLESS